MNKLSKFILTFVSAIALIIASTSISFSKVVGDKIILGAAVSLTGKYSTNGKHTQNGYNMAVERINAITAEPEINKIYTGVVANIVDFGAFVTIMPGRDGLVHISEISEERVEKVADYFVEGEEVKVKVLEVDRQGKIRLTMKGLDD